MPCSVRHGECVVVSAGVPLGFHLAGHHDVLISNQVLAFGGILAPLIYAAFAVGAAVGVTMGIPALAVDAPAWWRCSCFGSLLDFYLLSAFTTKSPSDSLTALPLSGVPI